MPFERLSPGAVLGDFLLVRKLGAGGMGTVYLAHQLSLDRPAAIKILNSEFSKDAESVQAFVREARSAARINHPNLVQAYAVGEEDGIFFFAMEFLDGKTMKEVLQTEKKIEPRRAAMIVMQVAEALDCAWREQKLIHRDIKPDNIMQCGRDRFKLADLGLAGTFGDDNNEDSDEVIGTPQYINPEQLTGKVTDTRSDIYSLGATFYHFITGRFPFYDENIDEIAKKHLTEDLVPPVEVDPQLPKVLSDIIVKMMAKDPAQRYQDCSELIAELQSFLNNADAPRIQIPAASAPAPASAPAESKLVSSGNMSVQPKMQPGGSGIKLSLKPVENKPIHTPAGAPAKPEEKNAEKPVEKVGEKTPAPEKPAPAPAESKLVSSGNMSVQPKMQPGGSGIKLSLKPVENKPIHTPAGATAKTEEKPAEESAEKPVEKTEEKVSANEASAAPKAAPGGAKINLKRPAAPKPPAAPAAELQAAPEPEVEPEAEPVQEEEVGNVAVAALAMVATVPENTPEEIAEKIQARKKTKACISLIAFLSVLLLCGIAAGGGFLYHKSSKAAQQAAIKAAGEVKLERKEVSIPTPPPQEKVVKPKEVEDPFKKLTFMQVLTDLRKKCDNDLGNFAKTEKSEFVEKWAEWGAWRKKNAALANAKAANNAETQLYNDLQKRYNFLQKAYSMKNMSLYKRDNFLQSWNSLYGQLKPADNRERAICDQLYRIYVEKYADRLFELAAANGDRFVLEWCKNGGENTKFQKLIKTPADQVLYQRLCDAFMLASENRIDARRQAELVSFNKRKQAKIAQLSRVTNRVAGPSKRTIFLQREKAADKDSLNTEWEYKNDLPRKMARLDVALLDAGTNRRTWNTLVKEIAWARQEKVRLKDHPELHKAAEQLIEYANMVERIAEQGRYFTDTVLARQTMRGKYVEDEKRMVTVMQTNAKLMVLRDLQKAIPGRAQKIETIKLDLVNGNIRVNNQWLKSVETLCQRGDQYFYYMMFNGYWNDARALEDIAPAADRQYWRDRNIERMAYHCFKRKLWMADDRGVAALKSKYGSWKVFQRALNDFQAEMR